MKQSKKVIEFASVWSCENLDTLAPITQEGICALYDDGSTEIFWSDDAFPDAVMANEAEIRAYRLKVGMLMVGDLVEVVKGRKLPVGSRHFIDSFSYYVVPGTYGHAATTYVNFTDGTRTAIGNVTPVLGGEALVLDHSCLQFSGRFINGGRL